MKLRIPRLYALGLFEDGPARTSGVVAALFEIQKQATKFRSAVELMDHTWSMLGTVPRLPYPPADLRLYPAWLEHSAELTVLNRRYGDWNMLTAEAAAMTVFHFVKAVEALKAAYATLPELHDTLSAKDLKAAAGSGDRDFPGIVGIRDWIAHQAQVALDPAFKERRLSQGDFDTSAMSFRNVTDALIGPCLNERALEVVIAGKTVAIEISEAMADKIDAIASSIFDAMQPLTAATSRIANQEAAERARRASAAAKDQN